MLVNSPCGWANGLQNTLSQKNRVLTIQVGGAMLEVLLYQIRPLTVPYVVAVYINASNLTSKSLKLGNRHICPLRYHVVRYL